MGDLADAEDASEGEWIAPRLGGEFGAVTRVVPCGYAAYARICHPASDTAGRPVGWAEVAEATGRTAHSLMQWHALVGSSDPLNFRGSLWPGGDPERGNLSPGAVETLCEILANHSSDPEHCLLAVWDGWAWVHGGAMGTLQLVSAGLEPRPLSPVPAAFSGDELSRARLVHPGDRAYIVLGGPLSAVPKLRHQTGLGGFEAWSPNLLWPADRAWCVATEIDFDSTLIGGARDLIEALLDAPGLDAWQVHPDDSIAADADRINLVV